MFLEGLSLRSKLNPSSVQARSKPDCLLRIGISPDVCTDDGTSKT